MGPNQGASSKPYCTGYRNWATPVAIVIFVGALAPLATAYRGTVPIFPDLAEGRKRAAVTAAEVKSHQRPKVFAPQAVIKTTELSKVFDNHRLFFDDEHVKALDGITVEMRGPGAIALVGDTGAGKTTFFKCLAGLEEPSAGDIAVSGLRKAVYVGRGSLGSSTGKTVRRLLRHEVASNLSGKISRQRRNDVEVVTNTILDALDLHKASRTLDRDLSGGEVYRFALAMALAKGCSSPTPPVILLDGFFDKSDTRVRYGVEYALFDLQKKMGVMLMFTAHSHQIVMELAKYVAELSAGKITEISTHERSRYARFEFERMRMEIENQARRLQQGPPSYF